METDALKRQLNTQVLMVYRSAAAAILTAMSRSETPHYEALDDQLGMRDGWTKSVLEALIGDGSEEVNLRTIALIADELGYSPEVLIRPHRVDTDS